MSQNLAVQTTNVPSGGVGFTNSDALGNLRVNSGALNAAPNKTAAAVIKTGAGRFYGLVINAPGSTSGAWSVNDSATTGAAAAENLLGTVPYNATVNAAGNTVLTVPGGIPFTNGLTLSAVPGAGSPICTVLYS